MESSRKIYRQLKDEYRRREKENWPDDQLFRHMKEVYMNLSKRYTLGEGIPDSFQVPHVRYGRTELSMPILTCGGMRFQQTWKPHENFTQADVDFECQRNLEVILARSLKLGINHIETAKMYGCSELQLGNALKKFPREDIILQTKIRPMESSEQFRKALDECLNLLQTDVIDLLSLHGINLMKHLDWIFGEDGNMRVVREYQAKGKVRFVGFSTHATTDVIMKAIETNEFDYVNLHYHFIGSYTSSGSSDACPGNLIAIEAATERDMGIFIISPYDKGGKLYKPPQLLTDACSPYCTPLEYGNLWLWKHIPQAHTLVIGAARPEDFDEHIQAVRLLENADEILEKVGKRLDDMREQALGKDWIANWYKGLPNYHQNPDGINISEIVWLWSITKSFGLWEYSCDRYAPLVSNWNLWDRSKTNEENVNTPGFIDFVPGNSYLEDCDVMPYLQKDRALEILKEANEWFHPDNKEKMIPIARERGWLPAFDLQPDLPYPERPQPTP